MIWERGCREREGRERGDGRGGEGRGGEGREGVKGGRGVIWERGDMGEG